MIGLMVLAALPLMLLGGLLLDAATQDDPQPQDEDAPPPKVSDTADEDDPIV